jgi:hypothetical protein
MLDDIERCNDNDPVMLLAKQLKAEVARTESTSDGSSSEDEDGPKPRNHNKPDSTSARIKFPPVPSFVANINQVDSASYPKNISNEQVLHTNATYNRLRTLTELLETSTSVIEEIEPKCQKLDAEAKEFLESCKQVLSLDKPRVGVQEKEKENDADQDQEDDSLL